MDQSYSVDSDIILFVSVHRVIPGSVVKYSIDKIDSMGKKDLKTYLKALILEKQKVLQQKQLVQEEADHAVKYYRYNGKRTGFIVTFWLKN